MKILVVDDERNIRESIQKLLELDGIASVSASDGAEALEAIRNEAFDAIVTDLRMPGMGGQELLEKMRSDGIRSPVIMISALGEIGDAVKALKTGAVDYLIKPFDPDELIHKLRSAVENRRRADEIEAGSRTKKPATTLIGESETLKSLRKMIDKVAKSDTTVLITGESGAGKEVVAREIHTSSPRAAESFIAVNIGAVHENLMESELFGHEKGSFTGADERKIGLFELAGPGTLFLDEIGEMPLALQVKLLRVLQERKIRRLGGTRDIPVAARILSATNQDIETLVREGKFREDLYYRLNVVRIAVPSLRERREDIPLLSDFLLNKLCTRMARQPVRLSEEAREKLLNYPFPGNVRELENVLERALIYSEGEAIEASDISLGDGRSLSPRAQQEGRDESEAGGKEGEKAKAESLESLERAAIERALAKWGGNRTKAAEELGISRRTIINKIKIFGL